MAGSVSFKIFFGIAAVFLLAFVTLLFLSTGDGLLSQSSESPPVAALTSAVGDPSLLSQSGPVLAPGAGNPASRLSQQAALAAQGLSSADEQQIWKAFAFFQTGGYEQAVALLRAVHLARPQSDRVKADYATALVALGVLRIQQQRLADAEEALEEAVRLGNPDAPKVLARVKLRQGDLENASSLFEGIFDKTSDPRSLQLLVDLQLTQDNVEEAEHFLNLFERNAKAGRDGALSESDARFLAERRRRLESKKTFALTKESVERGFIQVAYSSPGLRPLATRVAEALEGVLDGLSELLGPYPQGQGLKAWLFPSNEFRAATGAPPWAGALFDGFIRIPVPNRTLSPFEMAALTRHAKHEATHAYLFAFCGDQVPSWLGEGLAQHFEGRPLSQAKGVVDRMMGSSLLPQPDSAEFDGDFATFTDPIAVELLYARAHVLVEAIHKSRNGIGVWRPLLTEACAQRSPFSAALEGQLGQPTGTLLWKQHITQIRADLRR